MESGETDDCDYTGFASLSPRDVDAISRRRRTLAQPRERTRVQEIPKSIARVNARLASGIASSSASASPRGQRRIALSKAKSCVRPCVNAMPA